MASIQEDMNALRGQVEAGAIQRAYRALLGFMMGLRTHFRKGYPGLAVSGLYQGYLDMSYFAVAPASLKSRKLKIAIVFSFDAFRFEAWLAAANRRVQRQYWELFREKGWDAYRLVTPAVGVDAILECVLAEDPDLGDPDGLTARIEARVTAFIEEVEGFLAEHEAG